MVYKTIGIFGEIIYTNIKSSRKWSRKILPMLVLYLIGCIYWSTCSSSISNPYPLTTNTGSFTGITYSQIHQVVEGPVSLNLYYLYYFMSYSAIRRVGTDDTLQWMAGLTFGGYGKRMVIDSSEQNLYMWNVGNPLSVMKFQTSDGVIIDSRVL